MTFIFWALVAIVVYAYIGYGFVLFCLKQIKTPKFTIPEIPSDDALPSLTMVVAAFNEEDWIEAKIQNSLDLTYPSGKYFLLFVTDGSNDGTATICANYAARYPDKFAHTHEHERQGKIAAVKRVMHMVKTPITIYSDANTDLNLDALLQMVRHFSDPKVGAVAGEKRIFQDASGDATGAGEGFYWKYESKLKTWDAELYSVVGAAGELFGIRTDLFVPVPVDTIIEDFYMTLKIAMQGYRVTYEPKAYALEGQSASIPEEMKRKVRIAAGGLQAIYRLSPLLNIFKYGWLSFQYISHRVLRWTLAPLALPFILLLNIILAQENDYYKLILAAQVVFYLLAFCGYLLQNTKTKLKVFFIPFYFVMMNLSVFQGFFRIVAGKQSVKWERAKRAI